MLTCFFYLKYVINYQSETLFKRNLSLFFIMEQLFGEQIADIYLKKKKNHEVKKEKNSVLEGFFTRTQGSRRRLTFIYFSKH